MKGYSSVLLLYFIAALCLASSTVIPSQRSSSLIESHSRVTGGDDFDWHTCKILSAKEKAAKSLPSYKPPRNPCKSIGLNPTSKAQSKAKVKDMTDITKASISPMTQTCCKVKGTIQCIDDPTCSDKTTKARLGDIICAGSYMCPGSEVCCHARLSSVPGVCKPSCTPVLETEVAERCDTQADCVNSNVQLYLGRAHLVCCKSSLSSRDGFCVPPGECETFLQHMWEYEDMGCDKKSMCRNSGKRCCEKVDSWGTFPSRKCLSKCTDSKREGAEGGPREFSTGIADVTGVEQQITLESLPFQDPVAESLWIDGLIPVKSVNLKHEYSLDMVRFSHLSATFIDVLLNPEVREWDNKLAVKEKCEKSLYHVAGLLTMFFANTLLGTLSPYVVTELPDVRKQSKLPAHTISTLKCHKVIDAPDAAKICEQVREIVLFVEEQNDFEHKDGKEPVDHFTKFKGYVEKWAEVATAKCQAAYAGVENIKKVTEELSTAPPKEKAQKLAQARSNIALYNYCKTLHTRMAFGVGYVQMILDKRRNQQEIVQQLSLKVVSLASTPLPGYLQEVSVGASKMAARVFAEKLNDVLQDRQLFLDVFLQHILEVEGEVTGNDIGNAEAQRAKMERPAADQIKDLAKALTGALAFSVCHTGPHGQTAMDNIFALTEDQLEAVRIYRTHSQLAIKQQTFEKVAQIGSILMDAAKTKTSSLMSKTTQAKIDASITSFTQSFGQNVLNQLDWGLEAGDEQIDTFLT